MSVIIIEQHNPVSVQLADNQYSFDSVCAHSVLVNIIAQRN